MAVIGSDGLSLLVGDGVSSGEVFSVLRGALVTQLDITQRGHVGNAVAGDAWVTQVGAGNRQAIIECESYATDDAAALRLRSLALAGTSGNFRLQLRSGETVQLRAMVTQYREDNAAGEVKRLRCRLESSGAALLI